MITISSVLITDDVHPLLVEGLKAMGYAVVYRPDITWSEVKSIIWDFGGIVVNTKTKMTREMMEAGSKLKFIARLGSGLDIIDLEEAKTRGIAVLRSPEGNANAVAEHVIGMILAYNNKMLQGDREVRNFIWQREKNRGKELENSTVGIVGFGHVGSRLAEKLTGLNVKVLVYDKYRQQISKQFPFVNEVSYERLLEASDYISFHVPLTQETLYMMRKETFEKCKPGAVIINTSRGKVVRMTDLLEALEGGLIGGACLDVFENEKPATMTPEECKLYQRLYERNDVILTPHVAGWTVESKRKIAEVLLDKIAALG